MPKFINPFEASIGRSLTDAGLEFKTHVSSSGVRPDFLIEGEDGRLIVIEAKSSADPASWARFAHQAKLYETALGADRAFIVVNAAEVPSDVPRVISPSDVVTKTRGLGRTGRTEKDDGSSRDRRDDVCSDAFRSGVRRRLLCCHVERSTGGQREVLSSRQRAFYR